MNEIKCMVCGGPAWPCAPLVFCDTCRGTPEAEKIRQRHSGFIENLSMNKKECPCQDMLRDEAWEDFKKTRKYRELKKMFSKSQQVEKGKHE